MTKSLISLSRFLAVGALSPAKDLACKLCDGTVLSGTVLSGTVLSDLCFL